MASTKQRNKRYFVDEDAITTKNLNPSSSSADQQQIDPHASGAGLDETSTSSSTSKKFLKKNIRRKHPSDFVRLDGVSSNFQQQKIHKRRQKFEFVTDHSKRAALLLPENAGTIDVEVNESTCTLTQKEICQSVDLVSASKHFSLDLQKFGPYRFDYTRNGRYLLLGGKLGHVAAFDWLTKDLKCEINVQEAVRDVKWLHNEMMYAVAQNRFTFLYDSQGTELHCLKMLNDVLRLEFLPYHLLLAASSKSSFLHWVDVSMGKLVASFATRAGALRVMRQNPANAILHCGQSLGLVSLWSPNVKEPLMKIVCHPGPVNSLDVDQTGNYMATSGVDKSVKIWDLRTLSPSKPNPLFKYNLMRSAENICFSQQRMLACSLGPQIQVFKDICDKTGITSPYLIHNLNDTVQNVRFCPYEDVLGVGHRSGFTSLLIPGCAEPNIDVFEANPYQSKNQRRETEVKTLLDKIQPEMITLNTNLISQLDSAVADRLLKEKLEFLAKKKVSNSDIHLKHKMKGKSASGNVQKRRQHVRTAQQKILMNEQKQVRKELEEAGILEEKSNADFDIGEQKSALDRFRSKNK